MSKLDEDNLTTQEFSNGALRRVPGLESATLKRIPLRNVPADNPPVVNDRLILTLDGELGFNVEVPLKSLEEISEMPHDTPITDAAILKIRGGQEPKL